MKGFRTPSWFRKKGHVRGTQAKAQTSKPKPPKTKKRTRTH